ncbi:hypothetical protein ACP70R_026740 [Stipagrostis hirtigluma subsp. patula]
MASSSSSAPPPPWIILGRVALVQHDTAPRELYLAPVEPPRFSTLTVPVTVHPRPSRVEADKHPYVVAANDAGLLLHVSRSPYVGFDLGNFPRGVLVVARARDFLPADAAAGRAAPTCTAVRVPDRPRGLLHIFTIKSVGLLPLSSGEYVIAELMVASHAHLLIFRSDSNEWTEEAQLPCPFVSWPESGSWLYHDVVPHAGNLWWIDLAKGLLFCNPTDYHPTLRFVELPNMIQLKERAERLECIDSYRMVREIGGRLRFVDVARRPGIDSYADTMVVVWTLTVEMSSGEASWERVMTSLANIWEDESYRRTGMPEAIPELALMHPAKPDVVYFFLMHYLFGVDVRHGVVVDFARDSYADLVQPFYANPRPPINWRYVLTWVLPPSLLNAPGDEHHSSEGCQSSVTSSDLTDKNEST